jgi:hypothetical protein
MAVLDFRVKIHYNLVITVEIKRLALLYCGMGLVFTAALFFIKSTALTAGINSLGVDRDLNACGGAISCHLDASSM